MPWSVLDTGLSEDCTSTYHPESAHSEPCDAGVSARGLDIRFPSHRHITARVSHQRRVPDRHARDRYVPVASVGAVLGRGDDAHSSRTHAFRKAPMPAISVSITSPGDSRGSWPSSGVGVPVRITSPGRRVT